MKPDSYLIQLIARSSQRQLFADWEFLSEVRKAGHKANMPQKKGRAPLRAPFENTDAMQCLRKLNSVYVLRFVVTDRDKGDSRGGVPAWVSRILQRILEPVLRKSLHAAVRQTYVALL